MSPIGTNALGLGEAVVRTFNLPFEIFNLQSLNPIIFNHEDRYV